MGHLCSANSKLHSINLQDQVEHTPLVQDRSGQKMPAAKFQSLGMFLQRFEG